MTGNYPELDELDEKITAILSQDASITTFDLAKMLNLSSSATNERVRKLKKLGIIKRIAAFIDAKYHGMGICAFIEVKLAQNTCSIEAVDEICEWLSVMECHRLSNKFCYYIKVRFGSIAEMNSFTSNFLEKKLSAKVLSVNIVMESYKEESTFVSV